MLDLTGANLMSYLLRVITDAVNRNPRFKSTLGKVTFSDSSMVMWGDVRISIKDISTQGNRLSPDYFMCKQYGRALAAKVEQCDGSFIEWIQETDKTRLTPEAGVYYINVDSVDPKTNNVGVTIHQYRWKEGGFKNAQGSVAYLSPSVDGTTLTASDAATGLPVQIEGFLSYVFLLQPVTTLVLNQGTTTLTPMVDYWYQRTVSTVVYPALATGTETMIAIPGGSSVISFSLTDQTGYKLRLGIDYNICGFNRVQLSEYTPSGSTITANVVMKADPASVVGTNPENIIPFGILPTETIGQVFIHTSSGDYLNVDANLDGTYTLPTLLKPGEWVRWEVRIDAGQTQAVAKKYNLNSNIIPGLNLAMGDSVLVGDQIAIIVSPTVTETYEVFGSKESLNFTIEVRANDLQTSSDISELLKQQLLVMRRENMEADGVTIYDMPRSYRGEQRDPSGTAPSYTYTITVTAAADWKVYRPLVTRLTHLEVTETAYVNDFQGKIQLAPQMRAFGTTSFISSYS